MKMDKNISFNVTTKFEFQKFMASLSEGKFYLEDYS